MTIVGLRQLLNPPSALPVPAARLSANLLQLSEHLFPNTRVLWRSRILTSNYHKLLEELRNQSYSPVSTIRV